MFFVNWSDRAQIEKMEKAPRDRGRRKRVLAVASSGGHWVQLRRIVPALAQCDIAFVTTMRSYRPEVEKARFYTVADGNIHQPARLVRQAIKLALILLWERPDVVISTGAAPGYFAVRMGKWFGALTIWVDSMANAEKLSLSGRRVGPHADLWLTQWPHLARPDGPHFFGRTL